MSFSLALNPFPIPFLRKKWILKPWYLEGSLVESLEITPQNSLEVIKSWVQNNKEKKYKFVGILLNTETLSFEKTLKEFLLENQNLLSKESGPDFFILHPYVKAKGEQIGHAEKQKNLTYSYLHGLGIDTLNLPLILIFPFNGIEAEIAQDDKENLTIQIEQGRKAWTENKCGSEKDYLAYVFRSLFEAIKKIQKTETSPIKKLEEEFEKCLNKKISKHWTELMVKDIPNLPIIKEWIMPAIKLCGKFAGS